MSAGPSSWRPVIAMVATALSVGLGAGTQMHSTPSNQTAEFTELRILINDLKRQLQEQKVLERAVLTHQLELGRHVQAICQPECPEQSRTLQIAAEKVRNLLLD